jgi:hypothetical protein
MISPKLGSEKEIVAACEAAIRLAPAEFPPTLRRRKNFGEVEIRRKNQMSDYATYQELDNPL